MIPLTRPQNVKSANPDIAEPISSHTRWAPHTLSPSTLFGSDPPPSGRSNSLNRSHPPLSDYNKTDGEPVGEFLWCDVCRHMAIKDSLPEYTSFCEYTWELIVCMVITGEGSSGPDIWLETPNQGTGTEDMILTS